jgi:hypothetical protein
MGIAGEARVIGPAWRRTHPESSRRGKTGRGDNGKTFGKSVVWGEIVR